MMKSDGPPHFVISLEFELMWGVRDHHTKSTYGANVLGVRQAIPRMLEAFQRYGIRATWATVGFLFCESKDEMLDVMPKPQPRYSAPHLSNYRYLDEVGASETADPYYFGLSLLRQIQACPGQEIGTHTFSHFYCLENGVTNDDFRLDLNAAIDIANRRGVTLRSIVFPRNQYDDAKLAICREAGIRTFRGNERGWIYRPTAGASQNLRRRGLRLADTYLNLTGSNTPPASNNTTSLINVAASRFLRPYSARLATLDGLRLNRILNAMDAAAKSQGVFHLWWHPHNFGANLDRNMHVIEIILEHFKQLRDTKGMRSSTMGDFDAVS